MAGARGLKNGAKNPTCDELLSFIEGLPGSDSWIFFDGDEGEWNVTNEWLCGTFAGRSFPAKTKEQAALKLINYFNRHIGHDSIVGKCVTDSGWPDLQKVKTYLTEFNKGEEDEDSDID